MLSIGFFEILVIAVIGLLVFGPEKLPDAIRTLVIGVTKVKRALNNTRRDLEQELGMDEIRREIHNAQIMEDLELIKSKTQEAAKTLTSDIESLDGGLADDEHAHSVGKDNSKESNSSANDADLAENAEDTNAGEKPDSKDT